MHAWVIEWRDRMCLNVRTHTYEGVTYVRILVKELLMYVSVGLVDLKFE